MSITWADIVAHPDPEQRRRHELAGTGVDNAEGIKLTDPRRMAVYFARYGTAGPKEYQHRVPREWVDAYLVCDDCGRDYPEDRDECPDCGCPEADVIVVGSAGRFWGYPGLRPVLAVRQVTPHHGIRAGRVLRRWYRAKRLTKRVRRERVDRATGRITYRTTTCDEDSSPPTAASSPSTTPQLWPRSWPASWPGRCRSLARRRHTES